MSRRHQNASTSRLYVQHLAEGTDESMLMGHFRPLGATDACLKVGNHDIFGFVQFMSCEDATAAQKQMNGRMVDGSYLKVSFANDKIALRSGHEKVMPPPRRMATPSEPTLTLDELRRRHRVRSVESRIGAEREPSRSPAERETDVPVDSVSSMASPPPETSSDSLFVLVVPVNFKSDGKIRLDQLGQQIGNAIAACLQQS